MDPNEWKKERIEIAVESKEEKERDEKHRTGTSGIRSNPTQLSEFSL